MNEHDHKETGEKSPVSVRYSPFGYLFRFIGWWFGFSGLYAMFSVCPFCGQQGCPVGLASAGGIGAFLSLCLQDWKRLFAYLRRKPEQKIVEQKNAIWILSNIGLMVLFSLLPVACGDVEEGSVTVGVVNFSQGLDSTVEGFKDGMEAFGYSEGRNIKYIYKGATDSLDKLDSVARGLVDAGADLILSVTTPATLTAKRAVAGTDVPVVFVPITDPIGAGIVDSMRKPGGKITGIAFGLQEARRLKWLTQIMPAIKKIYIPYSPEDKSAVLALETSRKAALELGVELIIHKISDMDEAMDTIEEVSREADAIFLLPDSMAGPYAAEFAKLQLPISHPNLAPVEPFGFLTSYGVDTVEAGRQAARLAVQILNGTEPADIPVEMAEFYLVVNLKAAEALGVNISNDIILQADIIIR